MNSEKINARDGAHSTFKSGGFLWYFAGLGFFFSLSFLAVVYSAINGDVHSAVEIGAIFFPAEILMTWLGIVRHSDVAIDDDGISRTFAGMTWQKINWNNVDRIVSFKSSSDDDGTLNRAFNLFPKVKSGFRLIPSGKMVFGDSVDLKGQFIRLLNYYVDKYQIRLEYQTLTGTIVIDRL
jgi:hypothetical protein